MINKFFKNCVFSYVLSCLPIYFQIKLCITLNGEQYAPEYLENIWNVISLV
jgi:hypothetical protein